MAKIQEEVLVINLSRLVRTKDIASTADIISPEVLTTIEQFIVEITEDTIVEVTHERFGVNA